MRTKEIFHHVPVVGHIIVDCDYDSFGEIVQGWNKLSVRSYIRIVIPDLKTRIFFGHPFEFKRQFAVLELGSSQIEYKLVWKNASFQNRFYRLDGIWYRCRKRCHGYHDILPGNIIFEIHFQLSLMSFRSYIWK